jgi:sigma-B regulation protein RsbU (phosphoserine phosphatase)
LFTDGLTDAQNDQEIFYGEERLLESARLYLDRQAQEVRDGILADVQRFVGKTAQFDDITLMVIHRE